MKNTKVVVIDSGIANYSGAYTHIIESYAVIRGEDDEIKILSCESMDYIGHGSAVSHIIYSENPDVDIISFRICNDTIEIDEDILLAALDYVEKWVDADIINISAGLTYSYKCNELCDICRRISKKGILIVSAFDNSGAISYPAMFNEVIGVDTVRFYDSKDEIIITKNGIVDVSVPDRYYHTMYSGKRAILKGTSFASAYITGLISYKYHSLVGKVNKDDAIGYIKTKELVCRKNTVSEKPKFVIRKAIIFPINKEVHAILRFSDLLTFNIAGIYDEKVAGRVGDTLFGYKVLSYESINWGDDFDTVILSCTQQLSKLTKHCYSDEIIKMAHKHHKNVYTFEDIGKQLEPYYYPEISPKLIPYGNNYKLHQCVIPIVGVWGTSSKQGKYTLQLSLIRRMRKLGYNTGHISTEPSGYLFDADFVFHYGYNAGFNVEPWECTAILNQKIWEIQNNRKDILITGGQSGTIPYSGAFIEPFFEYQYAFLSSVRPDYNILCINPHDEYTYVNKTSLFINSMTEDGVQAMVLYPVQAVETVTGIGYSMKSLTLAEQKYISQIYRDKFNIPVYLLSSDEDLDALCENIIEYFSE